MAGHGGAGVPPTRPSAWEGPRGGVQFHPEINHAAYLTWVHDHRNPSEQDRERLASGDEDLLAHEDVVLRGNRRLISNFTGVLRAAADLGAASR